MSKKTTNSNNTNKAKIRPLSFAIVRIELIEKHILSEYEPKSSDNIKFKLSVELISNSEKSSLLVKIGCSFLLDNDIEILSMVVDNEYRITNLKSYIINNKFSDKGFIEYIADLSLSHTRGIQSTIINNTLLNKLFIPVLQLDNIANEPIK